jgi:hypothetical protein
LAGGRLEEVIVQGLDWRAALEFVAAMALKQVADILANNIDLLLGVDSGQYIAHPRSSVCHSNNLVMPRGKLLGACSSKGTRIAPAVVVESVNAIRKLNNPLPLGKRPGGHLKLAASILRAGLAALGIVCFGVGTGLVLASFGAAEAGTARPVAILDHPVTIG